MRTLSSMSVFFISCGATLSSFCFKISTSISLNIVTIHSKLNSASIRLMYPVFILRMSDVYQIPANAPDFDPCCQGFESPIGQLAFHCVALEGQQCFGPRV
jgi:hypothetical protein